MKDGTGSQGLRDFAPDDPFCFGGILHLIADGDPLAQRDQPSQIFVQCLGGNAREGHTSRRPVVSRRERQPQEPGSLLGVPEEELVEIADPEEDESILMLGFDLSPLAHQWGIVSLWHYVGLRGSGMSWTSGCVVSLLGYPPAGT